MTKRKRGTELDLDKALRGLGRWMREHAPPPHDEATVSLEPSRKVIGAEEHSALLLLAGAHLQAHTPQDRHEGLPGPCDTPEATCAAYGAARAILRGLDAVRDRRETGHVERLRLALWLARQALDDLAAEVDAYDKACRHLHATKWSKLPPTKPGSRSPVHDHRLVCVLPHKIGEGARRFAENIAKIEKVSLLPQYASAEAVAGRVPGQKRRPLVLAGIELDLADAGWSLEEITAIIDDGRGGTPLQAKERTRKRIAPARSLAPRA